MHIHIHIHAYTHIYNLISLLILWIFSSRAATKESKQKRKRTMDGLELHATKALKVAKGTAKQAASRQVAMEKTKASKSRTSNLCPRSDGCARSSISGWEWHKWSLNASPAERARVRGAQYVHTKYLGPEVNASQWANGKGLSARTNRVKLRNLLAAAEGAELLKASQVKVIEQQSCFWNAFIFSLVVVKCYAGCHPKLLYQLSGKEKAFTFPTEQDP